VMQQRSHAAIRLRAAYHQPSLLSRRALSEQSCCTFCATSEEQQSSFRAVRKVSATPATNAKEIQVAGIPDCFEFLHAVNEI
jgi:hypothetical protein